MASKLGGTASGAASGAAAGSVAGPYGALIGGVIGGAIGFFGSNSEAEEKAKAAAQAAQDEILSIQAPPETARAILMKHLEQAGVLTPELEQKIDLEAANTVAENPQDRQIQMDAIQRIKDVATGGLRPEDYAQQNKLRSEVERANQSRQQALIQQMQARGMGGSGAELAAQLQGSQSGANRELEGSLDIGAQASQRALEALAKYGSMAGDVRGQDYAAASKNADIQNQFNRFKAENQIQQQQRNIAAKNAAQESNLQRQQRVSDLNAQMENTELQRQNQARATDWENQRKYHTDRASAYSGQAAIQQGYQNRSDAELKGFLDSGVQAAPGIKKNIDAWNASKDKGTSGVTQQDEDDLNSGKYSKLSLGTFGK